MAVISAIERLPNDCRSLVFDLLSHDVLRRLGCITQVGLSAYPQQTRLQHTLQSLEMTAQFIDKIPLIPPSVKRHLLAAVALEDVGRAPFSNSLDSLFINLPGFSAVGPVDVERTCLVVKHLEITQKLLSRHELSLREILELLQGRVPWRKAQWATTLIRSPLDIDRLQYVPGDMAHADGTSYDTTAVMRGLILGETSITTVLDDSAVDSVLDFLLQRARLYVEVYYEPAKLALEVVVGDFFRRLWRIAESEGELWKDVAEPKSIEAFLRWTDATVLSAFQGTRWNDRNVPFSLKTMRRLICEGQLQVAELRQRGSSVVDVASIEALLTAVAHALVEIEHLWLLRADDLPKLQVYNPGSICVKSRGRYRDLRETESLSANSDMLLRLSHCPIIVFPTYEFEKVQRVTYNAGLVIHNIVPLVGMKAFLNDSGLSDLA